jgi:hypothetical protein
MSPPFPCSLSLSSFFPSLENYAKPRTKKHEVSSGSFELTAVRSFEKSCFLLFFSLSQIVIGTLLGVCVLWNDLKVCVHLDSEERERERERERIAT